MKHGMSYEEMIKYVCWEMGEHKGRVREECRRMGVSYHTATSIKYGRIVKPGGKTLERMADYFLAKRGWQGTEWRRMQTEGQGPSSKTEYNCKFCKDTGMVAIRSQDGTYAFPGSVPDDAKGYADADCWYCDCARTPRG